MALSVAKALQVFSSAFNLSISAMYKRCEASLYDMPSRSWRAKTSAWAERRSRSLIPYYRYVVSSCHMIPIEKQTYGSDGSHYHSLSNDIKYGTNKFANLSVKINDIKNLYLPARIIKFKWPASRPAGQLNVWPVCRMTLRICRSSPE